MNEEVKRFLQKAEHALEVAAALRDGGYPSDASSKVYYAMFYAAQALLRAEGFDLTKHSAVESALGFHFAKTGRLDPRFHRMLIDARKIREIADYDIQEEIIEPAATIKIEEGVEFLKAIRSLLGIR